MRDLFVSLVILATLPAILAAPWTGILVWSWIGYMSPHRLAFGWSASFPFVNIIAIFAVFCLIFTSQRILPRFSREVLVLAALLGWFALTSLAAWDQVAALGQLQKVIKIQAEIFLTLAVITNRLRIRALVAVIALSIGFYGIKGSIFVLFSGGQYQVLGPSGTFIAGNTDIALAMVMVLPLLRYLQLSEKRIWLRVLFGCTLFMTCVSVLGTYSRGGLVALLIVGGLLLLKSRRGIMIVPIFLIVGLIGLMAMPEKWSDRMATITDEQQDLSVRGRFNAWGFAWNVAKAYPLTGLGFHTFNPQLFLLYAPDPLDYHDAHNIYFKILAEHGFPGLALFLGFYTLAWFSARWTIRQARHDPELRWAHDLCGMCQVSLIGYAAGGMFLGMAYFDLPYHLVAVIVLTKQIVREAAAQNVWTPAWAQPARLASGGVQKPGSTVL